MEEWQMSIDPKIERPKLVSVGANLREEDGWIFRERPGLPIECVRRAAEGQIVEMTPPNQTRHSYPSA
jgi:hypothetical protein